MKDDLGTLVLDGVNSYAGDTIVRNGWLVGDVDSIRNNLLNNAGVTFLQHEDATFAGVIEGTGRTVKDGSGTLKLA
ncbi:autotransporter-associated beta strand repeat-containing protein, partial [Stenotrophomonas maltophilia]|uniref:autotransporter-associated beta strand repeat-containing protein n=1 Tax=Stenotrophomonas maltophilia TaxID=40324 RepID=UPI0013DA93D3